MDGANTRLSRASKALMAIVLACTLAFPYAALAADQPGAELQGDTQRKQLSDTGADSPLSDDDDSRGLGEASGKHSETDAYEKDTLSDVGEESPDANEAIASDQAEDSTADAASLSEIVMLADHSVATEQQLRDALTAATASPDQAVSIELMHTIQLSSTIAIALKENDQVTIGSTNGASLIAPANERHFAIVGSGAAASTECLLFKNIVLDGAQNGGGMLFSSAQAYYINEIPGGSGSSDGYSLTITNCTAANGGAIQAVPGAQLELHGLTLTGNSAERGGAIYAESGATIGLYQSSVKNNHASSAGGGLFAGTPTDALIDAVFCGKTSFESNSAPIGGALYAEGNVRATASSFRFNQAVDSGGAIHVQAANATLAFNECGDDGTPTRFEKNEAGKDGGALFASVAPDGDLNVIVNYTEFANNKAKGGNGGALALYGNMVDVMIEDCGDDCNSRSVLVTNTAAKSGGAIYAEGAEEGRVAAGRAAFIANAAGLDGGAVLATGEHAMVSTEDECTSGVTAAFQGNTAGAAGGAIRIASTGDYGNSQTYAEFDGRHGVFTNNKAVGNGGGISLFAKGDVTASLSGIDFRSNSSAQGSGGAIALEGAETWIDAEPDITASSHNYMSFEQNTAGLHGGALYLRGSTDGAAANASAEAFFEGVSVVNNSALAGDGGGLFAEADYVEIEMESSQTDPSPIKTVFKNNQAAGDGGGLRAIGSDYAYVGAYETMVEDNMALGQGDAAGNGGGACLTGNDISFDHGAWHENNLSTLSGNTAANDGGAIYADGAESVEVEIENAKTTGNTAQNNGGAVYMRGTYGSFGAHGDWSSAQPDTLISMLSENTAIEGSGGAVYAAGGIEEVYIATVTLYGNKAALNGGAVYVDSQPDGNTFIPIELYVEEAVVEANEAGGNGGAVYLGDGASDEYGHSLNMVYSKLLNNEAHGGSGGAVYLGAHAEILEIEGERPDESMKIDGNKAALNGGAVYIGEGLDDGVIESVDLSNNNAGNSGGALYFAGIEDRGDPYVEGQLEIYDSTFDGNAAGMNGGAIWLPYKHLSQLMIDDEYSPDMTVFSNNAASRETESHLVKNDADVAMHGEKVFTSQFSANPYSDSATRAATPFAYAYNNFDVSYLDIYLVIYDGNGATAGTVPIDHASYAQGDTAMVLGQGTLERNGFTFGGWALASDSGEAVGDNVQIGDADVTLYAIWHANSVDPADPADPSKSDEMGSSKARDLATVGDTMPPIAAFGVLALAALTAVALVRRRVK